MFANPVFHLVPGENNGSAEAFSRALERGPSSRGSSRRSREGVTAPGCPQRRQPWAVRAASQPEERMAGLGRLHQIRAGGHAASLHSAEFSSGRAASWPRVRRQAGLGLPGHRGSRSLPVCGTWQFESDQPEWCGLIQNAVKKKKSIWLAVPISCSLSGIRNYNMTPERRLSPPEGPKSLVNTHLPQQSCTEVRSKNVLMALPL